jgi:PAS domain S-box-containing protein
MEPFRIARLAYAHDRLMKRFAPTAFSVSLFLVCLLVAALVGVLTWDLFTDSEVDRANEARASSLALADELLSVSNTLGQMATNYIVTGDPAFRRRHRVIVAIRDGKLPRPNAGRIFWGRYIEGQDPSNSTAPGRTIALVDMLGEFGLTPEEAAKLREVKDAADAITALEIAAMKAVDDGAPGVRDVPRALSMLNNAAYRKSKNAILAPNAEFRALLDSRTQAQVDSAERDALTMRNAAIVITLLLAAILVRTYWVLHRVMGGSIDHVHARIAALGHGDFSKPIVVPKKRHNSVMGWLADTQAKLAANREDHFYAMRKLQDTESQFRQLAENIREVFFLANATCTEFTYVSPGYEELWGQTCESLYADPASWHTAIHPDDRRKVQAAIAFESADGKFEYECRIIRPDGTLRWIRVRAFPIRGEHGHDRIAGFAVDTTHRTKLEVVTRDDGRRFGSVVDHLHAPCFIANTQGRITYCNDAALALTGWSRVELLGRPCSEILAPFAVGPVVTASNESGSWRVENRVMARGGSLAASTWRHIRLTSDEGVAEGTAMLAEAVH